METYQQTIDYLYSLEYSGIKLGLENVGRLLNFMGNPQEKWPAVHIAGTNGKGSTAAFIHSILQEAGFKVGLYTSPHLLDFGERIRINDEKISWDTIVQYTHQLKDEIEKQRATFFEATTALAFAYFADRQVDIAIIETGLGGRLDATNLVRPLVTVITSISEDHQQYLGNTLTQIAFEKAGIIKAGIPCITIQQQADIMAVLQEVCEKKVAPFQVIRPADHLKNIRETLQGSNFDLFLPHRSLPDLNISLAGSYQVHNASLATATVLELEQFPCSETQIRAGLSKTSWPGRFQKIAEQPLTILDVAHNPDGFEKILTFISSKLTGKKIHAIVGLSKDKDYQKIADILSQQVFRVGLVSGFSIRSLDPNIMLQALKKQSIAAEIFSEITDAYSAFRNSTPANDLLLIIGSHYLAAEFLKKIQIS